MADFHPREAPLEPQGSRQGSQDARAGATTLPLPPIARRGLRTVAGVPALLSVRQVAELLGVSTATVYLLCERGELAHVRVTNAIRVAPANLEAYLARAEEAG